MLSLTITVGRLGAGYEIICIPTSDPSISAIIPPLKCPLSMDVFMYIIPEDCAPNNWCLCLTYIHFGSDREEKVKRVKGVVGKLKRVVYVLAGVCTCSSN